MVGVNAAVRILPCCTPAEDAALAACCIGCARYGAVAMVMVVVCGGGGICGLGLATGTLNAVAVGCATWMG